MILFSKSRFYLSDRISGKRKKRKETESLYTELKAIKNSYEEDFVLEAKSCVRTPYFFLWLTYERRGVTNGQHVPHNCGKDGYGEHDSHP